MRKGTGGVNDKLNISVGDCETDTTQRLPKFYFALT